MLKGLSRLWMRSLVRAGKSQQSQARKLLKSLLTTPKSKAARKPAKPAKRSAAAPRAARDASNPLPGKWLASYYSSFADDRALPARRMNFWLYLPDHIAAHPASGNPPDGLPLVVMLHGCDQTATQFAQGSRMNQLAEKKGYAVLYPQQSLRSHPNRCWKWYDKATQAGGGDAKILVGLIEKVADKYAIDRTRISICGISAGAAMANIIALNYPQLIAAVGLHSGPTFGAAHNWVGAFGVMQHGAGMHVNDAITEVLHKSPAFPSMPTILIQGEADKVVRPINQIQLTQQCLLLNHIPPAGAMPVVCKPGTRVGSRKPGNAYEIHDFYLHRKHLLRVASIARLVHAWSGGDDTLDFNCASGPDASKMMLEFFARHRRTL